jgi:hypothetical protein
MQHKKNKGVIMQSNLSLTLIAKRFLAGMVVGSTLLMGAAAEGASTTSIAAPAPKAVYQNIAELLNIAGKQRMLSQRIAKDYLYIGKQVAVDKATKQFSQSLDTFKKGQTFLLESISDPEIKNLIAFVNMSEEELEETAKKPFSLDNAQLVLDLSESMLEGSQYIVDSLKGTTQKKDSIVVATSGKQRMLSQRIAKYYIAYQAGIQDKNTIDQMKKTVKLFDDSNKNLLNHASNTAEISQKLKKINMLWGIVYKFYLSIEKGGLPFIVFTSTDDITKKMDHVTELYTKSNL